MDSWRRSTHRPFFKGQNAEPKRRRSHVQRNASRKLLIFEGWQICNCHEDHYYSSSETFQCSVLAISTEKSRGGRIRREWRESCLAAKISGNADKLCPSCFLVIQSDTWRLWRPLLLSFRNTLKLCAGHFDWKIYGNELRFAINLPQNPSAWLFVRSSFFFNFFCHRMLFDVLRMRREQFHEPRLLDRILKSIVCLIFLKSSDSYCPSLSFFLRFSRPFAAPAIHQKM